MLDKLFSGVDKFRLGELKDRDNDIIYGKSFDDEIALQAKSLKFDREVRKNTGTMYFDKEKNL